MERKTEMMESVPGTAGEEHFSQLWDAEWKNNLMRVALEIVKPRVAARSFHIFQQHVLKDWPVEKVMKNLGVGRAQIYVAKHRVSAMLKKELTQLAKRLK